MACKDINLLRPKWLQPIYDNYYTFIVLYGGRGGAKSFSIAGLSIHLCKFIHRQLNSPFKFDGKMRHSYTPISDGHSPFSCNVVNCQV